MNNAAASPYDLALERVRDGANAREEARALIQQMTQEERLHCLDGGSPFWAGMKDMSTGGYHMRPFPACRVPRLGIRGFHFSDGPRGVVIGPATAFPVSMARGASFDPELEERIGDAIGRELRAVGADLYGGVCVNLLRHPAWGRAQETYGEDPFHVGEMGAALARGAQRHVMATVKHFALNSMENARFRVDVRCDERTLHEVYLPHFKRIIDEGIACVMSAYNSVNGHFAGENHDLLTAVLRDEWGFDGYVISDWIFGLRDGVKSVHAGLDVEMPYRMIRHAPIVEAVESGELSMEVVDRAVENTLSTLLRFGVGALDRQPHDVLASPAHRALAREAAVESMVLLQNEHIDGRPLLPLDASSLRSVAVLGRLSDVHNLGDGGSSDVLAPHVVTPLEGIRSAFPGVDVLHADGSELSDAVRAAGASDVAIVVVGYTKEDEGEFIGASQDTAHLASFIPKSEDETLVGQFHQYVADNHWPLPGTYAQRPRDVNFSVGGDRSSLRLLPDDVELIRAVSAVQPRTIVVVVGGSAVVMSEWSDSVPAVLMSWYCGMEGGHALADVLCGVAEPGGRLPFVVPIDESHLPFFDAEASEITYEYLHGQWLLDSRGITPHFPFGFGKSYTEFELTNVRTTSHSDVVDVSVDVRNVGARPGSTVVQVFASLDSSTERAPRRMVAFTKVRLSPGTTTRVSLSVPHRLLAIRDISAHDWWLEPGSWNFIVGQHAGDGGSLRASAELTERRYPV